MRDYILFILFKIFQFFTKITPKFISKLFLDTLVRVLLIIDKKHKKICQTNLDFVYGDTLSQSKKNEIINEAYENLGYNLFEFVENQYLSYDKLKAKIVLENEHIIQNEIDAGKRIILITAHYGNWELLNSFFSMHFKPMTVVGRPLKNKYLNDDLIRIRNANGSEMVNKNGSAKALLKALKNDKMVGLVIDQSVNIKEGVKINFLGKTATQSDSASKLSLKMDAVVIAAFTEKIAFGKYRCVIKDKIEIPTHLEGEEQIIEYTQRQADVISEQINKKPGDWFWHHKRFKELNKEIYSEQ